jgi:hypothetical protein
MTAFETLSHCTLRSEVTPEPALSPAMFKPPPTAGEKLPLCARATDCLDDVKPQWPGRTRWSWLLKHVFQADLDTCCRCGGPMRSRRSGNHPRSKDGRERVVIGRTYQVYLNNVLYQSATGWHLELHEGGDGRRPEAETRQPAGPSCGLHRRRCAAHESGGQFSFGYLESIDQRQVEEVFTKLLCLLRAATAVSFCHEDP